MAEELSPDICVIGGGPGGIAVATAAANHAVPVILVEKAAPGGANLAYGSVPSKAFTATAAYYETLRTGPAVGVTGAPLQVNFGKVHDHLQAAVEAAGRTVSAERLKALGVTVLSGEARFTDPRTVAVGDTVIRARRFVIAVGAVPALPSLQGLDAVEAMTVDAAFDLTRKPSSLLIIGADARGLEIAQAYNRLGVDATVIDTAPALAGLDPELAAPVLDRLHAEGVRIRDAATVGEFSRRRGGVRATLAVPGEGEIAVDASHLLVVAGRRPAVAGLGLEAAGISHDEGGILVDAALRTTNRRVHAIGDCTAGPASAGRAEREAADVIRAILFRLPFRRSAPAPFVAFTDPAFATVGLDEAEARRRHKHVRVYRQPFADNDLAQAERAPAGMVKAVATAGGRLLGAGIVGRDAGELIAPWSLALSAGLGIEALATFAPAYPGRSDASRRAAAAFAGPGLTPPWRRRIIEVLRKFG